MGFAEVFTKKVVKQLAGSRTYSRGLDYRDAGLAQATSGAGGRLVASVQGTRRYHVVLSIDVDGDPEWSCTCPAAADGSFCKHCVAVALLYHPDHAQTAINNVSADLRRASPAAKASQSEVSLESYLRSLTTDRLVELLLDSSNRDWALQERLHAEMAGKRGVGINVDVWRQRIRDAFESHGDYVDYDEVSSWADGVHRTLDAVDDLLETGHSVAVIDLMEMAFKLADESMETVHDELGAIEGIAEQITTLHFDACDQVRPEPRALARRLAALELGSELDGFSGAASTYCDILGDAGLAEYRSIVGEAFRALPPSSSGYVPGRYRIEAAMLAFAEMTGNVDDYIAVKQHQMRGPNDYLEIATRLVTADRPAEALSWARRGLDEHPGGHHHPGGLLDCTAGLLRMNGDTDGVIGLFWDLYAAAPSLAAYQRLMVETGANATWRATCVDLLRNRITAASTGKSPHSRPAQADVESLIDILIDGGESGLAWQVAEQSGCSDRSWTKLAKLREPVAPFDAIEVYERQALAAAALSNNDGYRRAVELLGQVKRLAELAEEVERCDYLWRRLRVDFKAKRNLQGMLTAAGWP